MNVGAGASVEIAVRIDRLVVETDHAVDAFALQRGLVDAVGAVIREHGVPAAWSGDVRTPATVIDGFVWDGLGAEPALARALAVRLYEDALAQEASA